MKRQTAKLPVGLPGVSSLFVLCTFIFLAYAYTSNFPYFRPVPEGCGDVFGYTHMAKALSEGRWFGEHTPRPFLKDLKTFLEGSGYPYEAYFETVAPPAYHLDDLSGKIINQYPPGTSLLLSLLPAQYRFHFFPPLCASLFLAFALLALRIHEGRIRFIPAALTIIFLFVMVYYPPPLFSLYDINSLAPTYGFLFAAGYLLRAGSPWAFLFLGTASLFRLANVVFSVPFFLIYLLDCRPNGGPRGRGAFPADLLGKLFQSSGLFLLGGFGFYLAYVWILTGSPFHPTYPLQDRAMSDMNDFIRNFHYFSTHSPWFIMHLIILSLILIVSLPSLKWPLIALALAAFNYLFFMLHRIHVINYPYATIFVLSGFLIFELSRKLQGLAEPGNLIRGGLFVLIVLLAALTLKGIEIPDRSIRDMYRQYVTGYRRVFSEYDVIWGSSKACIIEYVTGKPALSYNRGPDVVRDDIIRWFHSRGYRQAIWTEYADDAFLESVRDRLNRLGLGHQLVIPSGAYYGRIIKVL